MTDISRLAQKARRCIYFGLYWSRIGTGLKEQTLRPRHPKSQTRSSGQFSLTVVAMLAPAAVIQHGRKQPGEERGLLGSQTHPQGNQGCCLLGCFRIPFLHLFPGPAQGSTPQQAGTFHIYQQPRKLLTCQSDGGGSVTDSFFPAKSSFVSGWQKLTHK